MGKYKLALKRIEDISVTILIILCVIGLYFTIYKIGIVFIMDAFIQEKIAITSIIVCMAVFIGSMMVYGLWIMAAFLIVSVVEEIIIHFYCDRVLKRRMASKIVDISDYI